MGGLHYACHRGAQVNGRWLVGACHLMSITGAEELRPNAQAQFKGVIMSCPLISVMSHPLTKAREVANPKSQDPAGDREP